MIIYQAHQPLNDFEIKEARECFKTLDQENKGVTANELARAMSAVGKSYTGEEIQAMISKADMGGKGRVDFQDFLVLLENVSQRERRGNEPPSLWNLISCHNSSNVQRGLTRQLLLKCLKLWTETMTAALLCRIF